MSIDSTTIDLVRAISVCDSISEAAAAVYLSPAAASRKISSLEALVQGRIVDRGGKGRAPQITELGRRYLSWGESARRRFDSVAAYGDEEAGTELIRVAVLGAALADTGPAILEEWRARWPQVRLAHVPVDSHSLSDPLASADIAFCQLLGDEVAELGYRTHTTTTSSRAVVVPRSSELADAEWLSPNDVADAEWLYADPGGSRYARWMDDVPVHGASRSTILETPEQVGAAVEVTGNVALHTMFAQGAFETAHTRFVPLAGREVKLGVAIRAGDSVPPALEALYELAVLCHNNLDALHEL
ncbi:LysR family transcriptional regulator [Nocardiopsis sp. MG754419]|uniref:LysR family transcriptional regulator n=1 Tax=Nocardiopsis sp. MG754419 TaxID=2259865 RepID=UPI001BAA512E|nr:LysR family transcriptional regulator [Nocardiopsis sp. MG754419]MBR8740910.1 hypothetical protein [Nocardiopsis sp. MG754419]